MKVLFIRYKKSKGIFEGGEQGTEEKFRALSAAVDNNIDTYYIHDENKKRTLKDYFHGVWYFPQGYFFGLTPRRVDEIIGLSPKYDVIWIDRSIFGILAKKLKESDYRGKIIGFFHNVETVYFDAKLSRRMPFRNLVLQCVDKNDRWTCQYCDKIVTLTSRDSDTINNLYQRKADKCIPILFRDKYHKDVYPEGMTDKKPLCTVLAAYFAPNNEGILWFVRNVLPKVDVKFRIVGKGMARLKEEQPELANIDVYSDVPDLAPYFEEADMMILPIFAGSGMKVKTCESLMYGKNILATDEALEGYQVEVGVSAWRCNTAEEFIACINEFVAHPKPRFNQAARDCFLENYSSTAVEKMFRELLA